VPSIALQSKRPKLSSNSTGTLFINDTIRNPDVEELLHCLSVKLHERIEDNSNCGEKESIFNEQEYPLTKGQIQYGVTPIREVVYTFVYRIFKSQEMSPESTIMALVYVDRLVKNGIKVNRLTWKRLFLSVMMLAYKVWEDLAVWNADVLIVFPNMQAEEITQMERELLGLLEYRLSLSSSVFTQYYFEMRAVSSAEKFPMKPLDRDAAKALETRTSIREKAIYEDYYNQWKSKSAEWGNIKSPKAIID